MAELFERGPTAEDRISAALLENLLLLYPHGPPADEAQIRKWMEEIVGCEGLEMQIQQEQNENSTTSADGGNAVVTSVYERGLERAVKEWKLKASAEETPTLQGDASKAKVQKKSFSLFDQMDQGLWGTPRISMEEIQATATTNMAERLTVLQKVFHVDDLMLDWKDVLPLLQEGVREETDQQIINDFWMLHRKWFDQGRASTEHLSIRYDLCQNVLAAIANLVMSHWNDTSTWRMQEDSFTDTQEYLIDLWSLWYEMWYDLMQQPVGVQEENGPMGNMGRMVLFLIRDMGLEGSSSDSDRDQIILYPAHMLAFVDPTASWFRAWTTRMTPVELTRLANFEDICPDLWQRAFHGEILMLLLERQSHSLLLSVALRQHSLSIIRSILACTRLQWFPSACIWEHGQLALKPRELLTIETLKQECGRIGASTTSANGGNQSYPNFLKPFSGITCEQATQLFELFLQVGDTTGSLGFDQDLAKPIATICAEAIETILLGVRLIGSSDNNGEATTACTTKLLSQLQARTTNIEKGSFDKLLVNLVNGLETDASQSLPS
jgi:hypothetical protein